MNGVLAVWPREPQLNQVSLTIAATLERDRGRREDLWFQLDPRYEDQITTSGEPFAICALMLAMQEGRDLRIQGRVAPSLLANLSQFQTFWLRWRPRRYKRVEVSATEEQESPNPAPGKNALLSFSGGVDSCYSALTLSKRIPLPSDLSPTAALMVHGFDIPLDQPGVFERAADSAERMLDSLGLPLVRMRTNFRQLPLDWRDVFPTGLGGCLSLLQDGYGAAVIAGGFGWPEDESTLPPASNEITVPLLSSDNFAVAYDGAGVRRLEKIERLSSWTEALQELRVCWQGPSLDRNCCRCEKCVRNILSFRVLGLERPPCFASDVSDEQIRNLRMPRTQMDAEFAPILELADRQGTTGSWVEAMRVCVCRNRRRYRWRQLIPGFLKARP